MCIETISIITINILFLSMSTKHIQSYMAMFNASFWLHFYFKRIMSYKTKGTYYCCPFALTDPNTDSPSTDAYLPQNGGCGLRCLFTSWLRLCITAPDFYWGGGVSCNLWPRVTDPKKSTGLITKGWMRYKQSLEAAAIRPR